MQNSPGSHSDKTPVIVDSRSGTTTIVLRSSSTAPPTSVWIVIPAIVWAVFSYFVAVADLSNWISLSVISCAFIVIAAATISVYRYTRTDVSLELAPGRVTQIHRRGETIDVATVFVDLDSIITEQIWDESEELRGLEIHGRPEPLLVQLWPYDVSIPWVKQMIEQVTFQPLRDLHAQLVERVHQDNDDRIVAKSVLKKLVASKPLPGDSLLEVLENTKDCLRLKATSRSGTWQNPLALAFLFFLLAALCTGLQVIDPERFHQNLPPIRTAFSFIVAFLLSVTFYFYQKRETLIARPHEIIVVRSFLGSRVIAKISISQPPRIGIQEEQIVVECQSKRIAFWRSLELAEKTWVVRQLRSFYDVIENASQMLEPKTA